jgi:hypothetical protein
MKNPISKALLCLFLLVFSSSAFAQKAYEYSLTSDFKATQTGAPELKQIPNNDGLSGEFVSRVVSKTRCGRADRISGYYFEDDAGLRFNNPEGFIDKSYSIAFNFQLDEFISPPSWVRILSFTHTDDAGIHILLTRAPKYGTLEFWPYGTVGKFNFFSPNEFYQMILVRNNAGLITIYVNGNKFAEYDDSKTQKYVPQDPDHYIIWFRDYPALGSGEASPGFVSDIVLANFPWTEEEVLRRWKEFCSE